MKAISDLWSEVIRTLCDDSIAMALGVFNLQGELLYANSGMHMLLDVGNPHHTPRDYLLNPNFFQLMRYPIINETIFEGILTTGNGRELLHSIRAKAFRKENQVLIAGEYDVLELDNLNRQMTTLNQEISSLQRDLIKEGKMLEFTLTELRKTQAMLIHAEKMNALGQLIAGIAHEINNPIGFVINNLYTLNEAFSDVLHAYADLETLIECESPTHVKLRVHDIRERYDINFIVEDFEDMQRTTLNGAMRIKKIVEDLRTFSRLDEAERKIVNLLENIESTLSLVAPELKQRKITVNLDFPDILPVECYPSELNQAFMNVIMNAIQAIEQDGCLNIKGWEENCKIWLEFSDTGCGIPQEILNKIFNPFFTTKPVGTGTGLGLSLTYKIITERHGGTISVDSKINEGSVFRIMIPREVPK